MLYFYELGAKFWIVLGDLYNHLFKLNLKQFLNLDIPWYSPIKPLQEAVNIIIEILPALGILTELSVSELLIGGGIIGFLTFRLIKAFVGIVTGS